MNNSIKTKRERFETVAAKRVQKVILDLEALSKCANRNNYDYDETDVQKMFKAIKEKVRSVEAIYNHKTNKTNTFKF